MSGSSVGCPDLNGNHSPLWASENEPSTSGGEVHFSEELLSAIRNLVCPECGGAMGGPSKEFKCRGRCGMDWRSVWERAIAGLAANEAGKAPSTPGPPTTNIKAPLNGRRTRRSRWKYVVDRYMPTAPFASVERRLAVARAKGRVMPFRMYNLRTGLNTRLDPKRRSSELLAFEPAFRRKIVGQDAAIEKIIEIYQTFLAGLNPRHRPLGNLLFLGPTGSGKTRMVEAIAESLFGDERACIKIDCAEFQHSHEIAKLIGSPPGYLGHRETHPLLTQSALEQWHTDRLNLSILLFDEIEKASDPLWQLLLGILDKAVLTLGDNRKVDFSQCIIVMTSNLGAAQMNEQLNRAIGFAQGSAQFDARLDSKIDNAAINAARRRFSPEFTNRIDKVVVFRTLRAEHLEEILEIELGLLQRRILQASGDTQFAFTCTPEVKQFLLREGTDMQYGARHLKRAIERNIVFPLADLVATKQVALGDLIRIDLSGAGEMTFVKQAEGALVPVLLERYGVEASRHVATSRAKVRM